MSSRHLGSCLCGDVRFEIVGDFERFYLCHCSRCRKDTGSAHGANLFASGAHLTWLAGSAKVATFRAPSSRHQKNFCMTCGSALPGLQMDGTLLVVPAGSLDTSLGRRPDAHIFCASRADWDQDLASLPHDDGPPG